MEYLLLIWLVATLFTIRQNAVMARLSNKQYTLTEQRMDVLNHKTNVNMIILSRYEPTALVLDELIKDMDESMKKEKAEKEEKPAESEKKEESTGISF